MGIYIYITSTSTYFSTCLKYLLQYYTSFLLEYKTYIVLIDVCGFTQALWLVCGVPQVFLPPVCSSHFYGNFHQYGYSTSLLKACSSFSVLVLIGVCGFTQAL